MAAVEPTTKRVVAFIDGQNLFYGVKESFGYTFPNYDVSALASAVSKAKGWQLIQTRFYTGIPDRSDNAFWNQFWSAKLLSMTRQGVYVFSRKLRYRNNIITLPNGTQHSFIAGEEKGIDIRIALDVIRLAHRGEYDLALVFSQDQDLSEVSEELDYIAKERNRWIKMASAFPSSPTSRNRRGINKTEWVQVDKATYDKCIDLHDYRTKLPPPNKPTP